MIKIPLHNLPNFSERITLNEQEFRLELSWLDRFGYFILNLYDHEDGPIALGVKLQSNSPLLHRVNNFSGDLILIGEHAPNPTNLRDFELVHVL